MYLEQHLCNVTVVCLKLTWRGLQAVAAAPRLDREGVRQFSGYRLRRRRKVRRHWEQMHLFIWIALQCYLAILKPASRSQTGLESLACGRADRPLRNPGGLGCRACPVEPATVDQARFPCKGTKSLSRKSLDRMTHL